jgi:lysophospholipase L1-like esterase
MLDAYTPYIYTEAFQIAIKFQPTFAVIMLGTNDSSQERSLNSGRFENDYIFMVKKFQSLLLKTRIFLVTPPQILSDVLGYNNKILEQEIIPIIEKVAIRTCLPLIDVHSALNSSSFFFDGVHPNASGAKVIAQFVHNSLTTINT